MKDRWKCVFSGLALTGLALVGPFAAIGLAHERRIASRFEPREARYGTQGNPLVGVRYEKMRDLAHHLDARAQLAADKAVKRAHHGTDAEAALLRAVGDFARRSEEFHRRMDTYLDGPFVVRGELRDLQRRAERMGELIERAHVLDKTFDDWGDVLDVLYKMDRLLVEDDVASILVPTTPPDAPVYDRLRERAVFRR